MSNVNRVLHNSGIFLLSLCMYTGYSVLFHYRGIKNGKTRTRSKIHELEWIFSRIFFKFYLLGLAGFLG